MNFYAVIIFLLFFGPIFIKDLRSSILNKVPLILNFVFSLFVFQMISTDIYQDINWFFNNGFSFNQNIIVDTNNSCSIYLFIGIFNVLNFLLNNYILYILILLVVRKLKARVSLIKILPVIWVIFSASTILDYLNIDSDPNLNVFIPFVLITIGLTLFITYLIYSREFMKSIFIS